MFFKEVSSFYPENHTKHINALRARIYEDFLSTSVDGTYIKHRALTS